MFIFDLGVVMSFNNRKNIDRIIRMIIQKNVPLDPPLYTVTPLHLYNLHSLFSCRVQPVTTMKRH